MTTSDETMAAASTAGAVPAADVAPLMFNPFDPGFRSDPYALYRRLRSEGPVHASPLGFTVLSRYADCAALLRDARVSSDFRKSPSFSEEAGEAGARPGGADGGAAAVSLHRPAGPHAAARPRQQGVHAARHREAAAAHRGDRRRAAHGGGGARRDRCHRRSRVPAAGDDHQRDARRAAAGPRDVQRLVERTGARARPGLRFAAGSAGAERWRGGGVPRLLPAPDRRCGAAEPRRRLSAR